MPNEGHLKRLEPVRLQSSKFISIFHRPVWLTSCPNPKYPWCSGRALEVRASINTPVISQFSCLHRSMRKTFGCSVDFPRMSVGSEDLPKEVRTRDGAIHRTHTAGTRGKSTAQSDIPRMLQCGQLSCEITGVLTEIPTSRARLKQQMHSEFTQKVNHAEQWNNLHARTSLKSYKFSSISIPFKWQS